MKSLKILLIISFLIPSSLAWPATDTKTKADSKASDSLYKELEVFSKVLNIIRQDYVEDVEEKNLIYGAVHGMLATLDPHSLFMPTDVYKELKVDTEGKFTGIGLEITLKDLALTVVTPIEGSPSQKAGIRENDRILKIDGVSTKELDLSESVKKMRGKTGTKVHLTLVHEGSKEPFDVTLIREVVHIKSVRQEMPEQGLGYIRVASFQQDTTRELEKTLDQLKRQSKSDLKGLILDLRNNPGGLLNEAVGVSDLFLNSGTIVSTVSRDKEVDKQSAKKDGTESYYPMIVMVNGGSASAAEIVAGALQDHKRAVILGTQTFGKGSVQTIFDLGDGSAVKLTVAKYYTPKGKSIQAEGITPDIIVEPRKTGDPSLMIERYIREKDLPGHLKSPSKVDERKREKAPVASGVDHQKQVAIDYLKSWNLFKNSGQ